MKFELDTDKIDWALLREQKEYMVTILSYSPKLLEDEFSQSELELYEGLVSFLDYIQDQAAEVIGAENVFGKMSD